MKKELNYKMVDSLILNRTESLVKKPETKGFEAYYRKKIQELETKIAEK